MSRPYWLILSVFEAASDDLGELTVTSYISFCEDMCIPSRTNLTYNNGKPWFTSKLWKGDKVLYKHAKYTLEREIRVAKRNYCDKLRIQFSSSDPSSVWKGKQDITIYKTSSPSTVENQQQADNLADYQRQIIKDSSHPSHRLLSLLPSGRRLRSIRSRTSRLRDSFFPQAIRLMNSQN